jgi:ATP-dependent DNA helicase RecG
MEPRIFYEISNHSANVSGINSGLTSGINGGINSVRLRIVALMQENPTITTQMLADKLEHNKKNIESHIRYLKEMKIVKREGAKRNGKWIVK